ncbi:MAG: hypothetical protein NT128_03990 [Proteobacteria bacterium]|nr:hypothetical protein [Pseudomonadota bacterium]
MWFFIYFLIFAQCCFASLPRAPLGEDLPDHVILKRVTSYGCASTLSACVEAVVSRGQTVGVLDFDELLVKWSITNPTTRAGRTVATELGKRLDGLFEDPGFRENLHGLLIVTARLARPLDDYDITRRFSDEDVGKYRKSVMETTNAELAICLPNIAKFLRSEANFGGVLPDRLSYEKDRRYRRNGYTVHPNGFIWNCGVVVMGGAMDDGGEIRHCKHATLMEVLESLPRPKDYTFFYLDDSPKWFGAFLEKGFYKGVTLHLLHYNFKKAEEEAEAEAEAEAGAGAGGRVVLPAASSLYAPVEQEIVVGRSYVYSAVKFCCAVITAVCIVRRYCATRGLNPFNYIRDMINLMRHIAIKILLYQYEY